MGGRTSRVRIAVAVRDVAQPSDFARVLVLDDLLHNALELYELLGTHLFELRARQVHGYAAFPALFSAFSTNSMTLSMRSLVFLSSLSMSAFASIFVMATQA